ncbi:MAG: SEC-C metal-binding domain-containing protein, partial [bacterium]|nr:SEC-C metal-binding domain-containing protein [bacterium]
ATDYTIDEKLKTAVLSEHGLLKVEKRLGVSNLYEKDFESIHHIENALRAKTLFMADRDYVVRDGDVIIVDEFTGRLMFGRRYSEGLHQAIEAKEGVKIQQESRTLATISFQNYFRLYEKLAGMTGTAATEAEELHKIYKLDVVVIPTHKPMIRKDFSDQVYKTQKAKYTAVGNRVADAHKKGQPVLIGTTSIQKNEIVSELLKRKGIPHEVLNAKNHLREALIIENAGAKGAVTVATNMAGRGVDIKLSKGIADLGGLLVVGTERHESRRIDNQLRGRSGRQGDLGASAFYIALDDDIMRLFGGDAVARLMTALKIPEDVPIEHGMVSKAIENAQTKVEGHNFDLRKHLVEYDDVMNKQREIIYARRRKVLEGANFKAEILEKIDAKIESFVSAHIEEGFSKEAVTSIVREIAAMIPFDDNSQEALVIKLQSVSQSEQMIQLLTSLAHDAYGQREKAVGEEGMRQIERYAVLSSIDQLWMDHLDAMDDLREGIGLRGYAQKDPLVEYKSEAFSKFEQLIALIDAEITRRIFRIDVRRTPQPAVDPAKLQTNKEADAPKPQITSARRQSISTDGEKKKLGRNDPCWCGSGKKWKRCHYPKLG